MNTHYLMRKRIYERLGLELEHNKIEDPDVAFRELRKTEWSGNFEEHMRSRLILGALRYGKIGAKGKPQYDRMASAKKRIAAYEETGNKEWLVDIANLMLLEFMECHHPKAHFESVDEHDMHVERKG